MWLARWGDNIGTLSEVLLVCLLQPAQRLGIQFLSRSQADLELHGLVNLRGLQASDWLLTIDAKAEIDAVLRRGLYACERSAWRDERDKRLARLDNDVV